MKWIYYIFILFCFFPYINIINLGTDTQPNALVLSALILFALKDKRLDTCQLLLWILFACAVVAALFSQLSAFDTLKNILNYLSPAMIGLAAYNIFIKSSLRISFGFFLGVVLGYFVTGFVQMYIDPGFLSSVLNQGGRGVMLAGRGVVSLCPEPAFYGTTCLFFIVFSLLNFSKRENLILVPILLIQLVFFSQSATSIIILLAATGLFFLFQIFRFRLVYILMAGVFFFSGQALHRQLKEDAENSRAAGLIVRIIEEPTLIAQFDVSAGVRMTSTLSPFLLIKHHGFLPMGMGTYKSFIRKLYRSGEYPSLLSAYILKEIGRLGGGINMVLFHLGFIGLLFPLAIYLAFHRQLESDGRLFSMILFVSVLFTQIQLMHAMIGLILALASFRNRKSSTNTHSHATV